MYNKSDSFRLLFAKIVLPNKLQKYKLQSTVFQYTSLTESGNFDWVVEKYESFLEHSYILYLSAFA